MFKALVGTIGLAGVFAILGWLGFMLDRPDVGRNFVLLALLAGAAGGAVSLLSIFLNR